MFIVFFFMILSNIINNHLSDKVVTMLLILDGNSETGAHVSCGFGYLFCLRHLFKSSAAKNQLYFKKRLNFLHTCAPCFELPSYTSTMAALVWKRCHAIRRTRSPRATPSTTASSGTEKLISSRNCKKSVHTIHL